MSSVAGDLYVVPGLVPLAAASVPILADKLGFIPVEVLIVLGLMIPFLGILVPIVVLLLFQVSRPEPPALESAPPAPPPGPRLREQAPPDAVRQSIVVDSDELVWFRARLRESDVFEGLTDKELRYVAAIGHRRRVSEGERLAEGGSRGEMLFVILEGELRLRTHPPAEVTVRTAHAGESVPLAVIIDPPVLVTTVEAASDGEVFAIPRARLLDLFDKQPLIALHVYRAAAKVFEHRYRMTLGRGEATSGGST